MRRSADPNFFPPSAGASVTQVTATDADDATYGNSARVVYSILEGQPYFSVDPETGLRPGFPLQTVRCSVRFVLHSGASATAFSFHGGHFGGQHEGGGFTSREPDPDPSSRKTSTTH